MVSSRQRQEIYKHMRRIKDARDAGKSKEVINQRVTELYNYLDREGLINIDE
jgi:hypothetical protein